MPKKKHLKKHSNHLPDLDVKGAIKNLKRKIGLFYKINFFLFLIVSIVLAYFVILVSTEPKSVPFVTKKIESILQEKLGQDVSLSNSYISFTRYGTLKVAISSLKILYSLPDSSDKQAIIIPKLETEFSLLGLITMNFQPSKIKIIDANFVMDDLQKLQQADSRQEKGNMSPIIKFLAMIKSGEIPIENFEVENTKLIFRGAKIKTEILLKKSQIRASTTKKTLFISSINKVSFDATKSDVDLKVNCQLFEKGGLKCDLVLENFLPNCVASLHKSLSHLNQIHAAINATASLSIKDGELHNILFKATSKKGDFDFPQFFSQKMDFANFSVTGEYDDRIGVLNLSEIKTDFTDPSTIQAAKIAPSHLDMSLLISDLKNRASKKLDFFIKLQDVQNDKMEKFWPSALNQKDIRQWVITHIRGGMVRNAYAKFSLTETPNVTNLESMDAQVVFSDFNLEYDKNFPPISHVSGIANFGINGMKIAIASGDVLNSKISDGLVEIDNFMAPITLLKISGKSKGSAADGLKHVDYKSTFATEIEKYLNGDSQNDFDIRIPLQEKINLKDTYVAVNSTIKSLNNPYLRGGVVINAKKDFKSSDFIAKANLSAAELTSPSFDVIKAANIESNLSLVVDVKNPKLVAIKNIILQKKENILEKTSKKSAQLRKSNSKITGEIAFETSPFLLTAADLKNDNFGRNNFSISYKIDKKTSTQKLFLRGKQFNLAALLAEKQKFSQAGAENKKFNNLQIQIATDNLALLHNKMIKNFYLSLNMEKGIFMRGLAKGDYAKSQLLSLKAEKKSQDDPDLQIEGDIFDVGYFAEAFGISDTISGGDAKIKAHGHVTDNKQVLIGEITISDNITIYENQAVKKLASNTLFSTIKDRIFSNDKTIFDSVKVDFSYVDGILNIKSLIANNYKIGITAKGKIDLKNNIYDIRGMIVPGFIINNLFGIGKIPIIGNVISGLLTGGEGGGLFGIRYEYIRKKGDAEATFETNKISSFVPTSIKSLFDLI